MNIQEAKEEVRRTVEIYLDKDQSGAYSIPYMKQRPLFLLGAPGIGKTAIMEQIAAELDIALVSYSMTHHTRQSALGLPFIAQRVYDGQEFAVSDYTMSEIIASVYAVMAASGKREGILFLDEINCVSETLAPAMLQFLQYKEFGNKRVPAGWVIVTAGNPPEYNRSVREFDVATLDRIKCLKIQEDFGIWKRYAYGAGISGAILAFLELNPNWFYSIRSTVDGVCFVTARGWEDLSLAIALYEKKGFPVNTRLVEQYITDGEIARKFAVYYDLYQTYMADYRLDDILAGKADAALLEKAGAAKLDERIALLEMLGERLSTAFSAALAEEKVLRQLAARLRTVKKEIGGKPVDTALREQAEELRQADTALRAAKSLSMEQERADRETISRLERLSERFGTRKQPEEPDAADGKKQPAPSAQDLFKPIKRDFQTMTRRHTKAVDAAQAQLEAAFAFLETAFGKGQELILFMTQLTANVHSLAFIETWGSESYFRNNQELLIYDVQKKLKEEIDALDL